MKTQIFTVYDSTAKAFHNPYYSANVPSGQRAFRTAVSDQTTLFYKSSEDFTLWHIGEFDDEKGIINAFNAPINLGLATQYKDN
ncbi:MAG: nonstructural protein [Microvirus sp.]|nr:MAG: nonstructural protein [Microvirus sp.]